MRTAVDQVDSELTQLRAHRERVAAYQAAENGTSGRVQRTAELAMHARQVLGSATPALKRRILTLLTIEVAVDGFETCDTCSGRGKLRGGRGGIRCPTCCGTRNVACLSIRGEVPEALLAAGKIAPDSIDGATWPFTAEARAEPSGA